MTNLQVATAMVGNAIAYGKEGYLDVVMTNLELIRELLENPSKENQQYDWEDFK